MEYTNNSILIESNDLFDKLGNENLIIIDCDINSLYQRAHIKDSISLPVHHYIKQKGYEENAIDYPHIMNKIEFTNLINSLNINSKSEIIAYDNSASLYASRFWWALNYFGLTNVKVLNGGWKNWIANQLPIESGFNYAFNTDENRNKTTNTDIDIVENKNIICNLNDMQNSINDPNTIIFDTRNISEFNGTNSRGNSNIGHIPGAINIEWLEFVDNNKNNKFKSQIDIQKILNDKNITPEKQINTY